MQKLKTVAEWMQEHELTLEQVVQRSGLSKRVVQAIVAGQFTPSPEQRIWLADALGVLPDLVHWSHTVPVENMYGHGPQFGRSP